MAWSTPAAGDSPDADLQGAIARRFACFGKLPGAGDFVSRRMAPDIREFWDHWCADGIGALKAASTATGLDVWGATPTWAFMMPVQPGVNVAQLGVLAPSCDRVGRIFPFVVTAPLERGGGAELLDRAALLGIAWSQVVTQAQVGRLGIEAADAGLSAALAAILASQAVEEDDERTVMPTEAVEEDNEKTTLPTQAIEEDDEQTTLPMGMAADPSGLPWPQLNRRFDAQGSESYWWSVPPASTGFRSRMYTGPLKSLHFLDLCRGNR